ncbi:ROK family protein [Paenibacillus oenotherae]|uniref:ROK family protein n=1 Tax=Paenibacillus oenotherae TaxID=1435645 RepID=A0ABS7D9E7_9BACL|nr:ROK family protein [Paenibacillus oenotherae]MBW7476500.1 ROK family protein [Paenibacillus oenotherae]
MSGYVISVDCGATSIRAALFDMEERRLLGMKLLHHYKDAAPPYMLEELVSHLKILCSDNGTAFREVHMLVVGLAALHDSEGNITIWPNRPNWNEFPFRRKLEELSHCTVIIKDDAALASMGEYAFGLTKRVNHLLTVSIGTGIGSGIILNGELHNGANGSSGELGHVCVEPMGLPCSCGSRGCLQLYASGRAIERMAEEQLGERLLASRVFELAGEQDETAAAIVNTSLQYLAAAIANTVKLLDPDLVVLGGGLVTRNPEVYQSLQGRVQRQMGSMPHNNIGVALSALGEEAPLWGGLACFNSQYIFQKER